MPLKIVAGNILKHLCPCLPKAGMGRIIFHCDVKSVCTYVMFVTRVELMFKFTFKFTLTFTSGGHNFGTFYARS